MTEDNHIIFQYQVNNENNLEDHLVKNEPHSIEEVLIYDTFTLLRQSGLNSNYQKLTIFCLFFPGIGVFFIISLISVMDTFPNLLCAIDNSKVVPCDVESACISGTNYIIDTSSSIINWIYDFGLVCNHTIFLDFIYYFFFGGFLLGAVIFSSLADYFGRKLILLFTIIILCLVHLKLIFTTSIFRCAVIICCSGILVGIYYCVSISYLTEMALQ